MFNEEVLKAIKESQKAHHEAAIEEGLAVRAEGYSFSVALEKLRHGGKVARLGWNGKGMWVQLEKPTPESSMTLQFLYLSYPEDAKNTPGARVPWLASQTDLLATDWVIL
jgi:hypothetical protein